MRTIKVFVPDNNNGGDWQDVDEDLIDLSEHDAELKTDLLNYLICKLKAECSFGIIAYAHLEEVLTEIIN